MPQATNNYIVKLEDGRTFRITGVAEVSQVYAFLEFRDSNDRVILAFNRNFVVTYRMEQALPPQVSVSVNEQPKGKERAPKAEEREEEVNGIRQA